MAALVGAVSRAAATVSARLTPAMETRAARVLLGGFVVIHVGLTIGPGPTPTWRTVLALVALTCAASLVVLVPGVHLPMRFSVLVVAASVVGVALVVPGLPTAGWPGYAAWPVGAATIVAIGLTLRHRVAVAWGLLGAVAVICVYWSVAAGTGPLGGIGLVVRQIGVLVIGALFATGLRRAARAIDAYHLIERLRVLERETARLELQSRRAAVQRVLEDIGPTLTAIAAQEQFDDVRRNEVLALEGRLRDEIAIGPLLSDTLDRAMSAARGRGVDVVLLSDPGVLDLPTSTRLRVSEWLAERLNRSKGAAFVGRAVFRGGNVRVSASDDDELEDGFVSEED